ncbi:MAG TPA: family 10 glycosylhydrolase [Phycisphaerae bacterium]|jgi:uncharacterized lipoprotein YddW (UPF0748 family)|nr:family 10 glycosylhydrolase [Phycisphaerae bacterium]HOB73852.1 family 10 glycosylhydrolase [Phycisphaerae bacterium]HOJ53933.1 family 10 glycosylhydrolase [Phycisphaerae bacterium]HOL27475.1 family 10 glycosylhydrolase [Phycisphaerae bacterium]HPP21671.1 family 10 glycosylhydrolase [Phycisphaerae bacterium]
MKRHAVVSVIVLLAMARPGLAEPAPTNQPAEPFRAAYMHIDQVIGRQTDAAGRRAALAEALDAFKASGLRVVMPYVKDTAGKAAYESDVVPARKYKDWDALADIMALARERKLAVWPVICVLPSGGEKAPAGILLNRPEWALRNKTGKPIGYLSPCNPAARKWMTEMVCEIVRRYEPEGLLLDYLRFPSQVVQLDPASEADFEKQLSSDTPAESTERAARLGAFKTQGLTELARMISEETRRIRPGLQIGLYTWGPHVVAGHNVSQDWKTWAARGYVDMINVSGYCYRDNYGEKYLEVFEKRMRQAVQTLKQSGGKARISLCLGVRTSHGRISEAREIAEYRRLAREAGITDVAFFTWTYLQPFLDEAVQAGYLK